MPTFIGIYTPSKGTGQDLCGRNGRSQQVATPYSIGVRLHCRALACARHHSGITHRNSRGATPWTLQLNVCGSLHLALCQVTDTNTPAPASFSCFFPAIECRSTRWSRISSYEMLHRVCLSICSRRAYGKKSQTGIFTVIAFTCLLWDSTLTLHMEYKYIWRYCIFVNLKETR